MKIRSPDESRVLDAEGFKRRAACICLRAAAVTNPNINHLDATSPANHLLQQQAQEILLISSAKNCDHWMVPGGGVEPLEDVTAAAARETWEEAGVKGTMAGLLGVFEETNKVGLRKRTYVYKLFVEEMAETWAESAVRQRRWFPLSEAEEMLKAHKPAQKMYLERYARQAKIDLQHNLHVVNAHDNHHPHQQLFTVET